MTLAGPRSFIYKSFPHDERTNDMLDLVERLGIDYDIWNIHDLLASEQKLVEIGFSEKDWPHIPKKYRQRALQHDT